jgi:hypothetical protein
VTRRSRLSLVGVLATAGCLEVPPPAEGTATPASICPGDAGRPTADPAPWSIASLPGWSQGGRGAAELAEWLLDTGVFNRVLHGSISADAGGEVTFLGGDLEGSDQACAGVAAAHQLGYPIQVVLGGDRGDDSLAAATSAGSRARLVASLTDFIDRHGYDGVSVAWITDVDTDQLTALVDDLSAVFATRQHPPLLTVDVSSGTVPPSVSAGWVGEVDAINLMSYGTGWQEELERHLDAGIPPEVINLGIGLALADDAPASVAAKVDTSVAYDLKGVESWELGALASGDDPRLVAYRPLFE